MQVSREKNRPVVRPNRRDAALRSMHNVQAFSDASTRRTVHMLSVRASVNVVGTHGVSASRTWTSGTLRCAPDAR